MGQADGYLEAVADQWPRFYRRNFVYHYHLQNLAAFLIPQNASVLEFGCRQGELLASLPNRYKVGVESSQKMVLTARKKHPRIKFIHAAYEKARLKAKFDYILLSNVVQYLDDIQQFIKKLCPLCHDQTKIIVIGFNYLWRPWLDLATKLRLRFPQPKEPNWLTGEDIRNLFSLEFFEQIKQDHSFLVPVDLGRIGRGINRFLAPLPILHRFCLVNDAVFQKTVHFKPLSVSVVVPARNEAGNIQGILKKIPPMGVKTEVIFVEGHSRDQTVAAIKQEIKNYRGPLRLSFYRQKGKGKADAVRLGFTKAKNELLMVLDADLSVAPAELPKFYQAIANGRGELIMGSRLVYPLEKGAMRFLNVLGNKFFSWVFSYLLGQPIKDTLCGTKVLRRSDYQKITASRSYFGEFDPFGDFDLIFGAAKLNLKIAEIPIRYRERTYGQTNISRFRHGWLLLKMTLIAAKKIKFVNLQA